MNKSIKVELLNHLIAVLADIESYDYDREFDLSELHHKAFNEDHYIIGYYQAEQWLNRHNVSAWEAIGDVIQWEQDALGEVSLKPEDLNAERIVNLYVYVKGEELLSEFDLDQSIDEVLEDLKQLYWAIM